MRRRRRRSRRTRKASRTRSRQDKRKIIFLFLSLFLVVLWLFVVANLPKKKAVKAVVVKETVAAPVIRKAAVELAIKEPAVKKIIPQPPVKKVTPEPPAKKVAPQEPVKKAPAQEVKKLPPPPSAKKAPPKPAVKKIAMVFVSKPPAAKKTATVETKGRIAIVLDDWGYNLNNLERLEAVKYPLTLAVLPSLPYSVRFAKEAGKKNFEVILHLPEEPRENLSLEKDTIMTSMTAEEIIRILKEDLTSVYSAKGVSNHMGSKATEDPRTTGIIFKELKRRHLYFLDSFVSASSVCADLAAKTGLAFEARDVFLDNQEDPAYIMGQIYKLKSRARFFGQAIGIGHDRKNTLEVLRELMPEIEKEGYKFVFVSELIR